MTRDFFFLTFTADVMTVDVSSGGVMFLGREVSSNSSGRALECKATEMGSQGHLQKRYESGSSHLSTA